MRFVRDLLDISKPVQRAIATAACMTSGVAVAACLGESPQTAAALAAFGTLSSVASSMAASLLDKRLDRRLGQSAVLQNHDLTRAVGQAIGRIIEKAVGKSELAGDHKALLALAESAPRHWEQDIGLLAAHDGNGIPPLADGELLKYLAVRNEDFGSLTALDPAEWEIIVCGMASRQEVTLRAATVDRLATELHHGFATELRESVKGNSRAFAGLAMLVWGELIGALADLKVEVSELHGAQRQALETILGAVTEVTVGLGEVFREGFGEVIDRMSTLLERVMNLSPVSSVV
jgi:hypothetical protein